MVSEDTAAGDGERLFAQAQRLRLLLRHLAGRAVRARVEEEDLLQEVFLRALAHPAGLPPAEPEERALYRFLVRIARNCVVDVARALRARKREGRSVPLVRSEWSRVGVSESQVAAVGAGPATLAQGHEREQRLIEAFEKLSPDHRRVLGLRQLEGLSAAECATRMGRSETAVHSLYRRALEAWSQAASLASGETTF